MGTFLKSAGASHKVISAEATLVKKVSTPHDRPFRIDAVTTPSAVLHVEMADLTP